MGVNYGPVVTPEYIQYAVTDSTITVTYNDAIANIFKTSGATGWDKQAYSLTPFTAPCTIEFNKKAGAIDNGLSYAMIGWNADPTADASYSSIDWASYPYMMNNYQVYHNGSVLVNGGTWDQTKKFYIVYDTDGYIRHYNGTTLLASFNKGTGQTVYVDSSYYSPDATYGGFSNIRVVKRSWNGSRYV